MTDTPEEKRAQRQAYYAARYKANKTAIRAKQAVYEQANRDQISARKSAYAKANRSKVYAQKAAYRAANRDKVRAISYAWRAANPEKVAAIMAAYKLRKMGVDRPKPDHCEVCGGLPTKQGLVIDHCHAKGHFRGWLCNRCNVALAMVNDDAQILRKLIAYLRRTAGI